MSERKTERRKRGERSARESQRLFQVGDYWLGREGGSPFLYYYWYDADRRKVRRKPTKFTDLTTEAQIWLADLVAAQAPKDPLDPSVVTIKTVKTFFKTHYADKVRSKGGIGRAFDHIVSYLQSTQEGEAHEPTVAEFGLARQKGFILWCRDKRQLSCKSIATYLSYYKAGLNFAATPRLLPDSNGIERETKLLASAPYVNDGEGYISREANLPRSEPRQWIPTDAELAAFLDAIKHEHVFRFAIMMLNTWARPEAVCELNVKTQVHFEQRLVQLNPPGRIQTNKIRPTIALTDTLFGWLKTWDREWPIHDKHGEPYANVDNRTLQKVAERAGIAEWKKFTNYTFRHYMSTRSMRVQGCKVSREERAKWLGHKDKKHRTTEDWYESFDPEFLAQPRQATDAIMRALHTLTKTRSPLPPVTHHASGFMVIKGGETSEEKKSDVAG